MVRKDGTEARKERIAKIAANTQAVLYLNKELRYISLRKTVAKQDLETGFTREKIMEYLALFVEADQFEIDLEKDQIRRPRGFVCCYECVYIVANLATFKTQEVIRQNKD